MLRFFSYGFIISNLLLLFYFFNTLVEGLAIDRFPWLYESSIFDKIHTLNQYPYEFVLAKAEKHLEVFYEPHKVYLSLHFMVAFLFCIHTIFGQKANPITRLVLGVLALMFLPAILYTQAITTVLTMVCVLLLVPFFYFQHLKHRIIYLSLMLILGVTALSSGVLDSYKNKNTLSAINFLNRIWEATAPSEVTDKRALIYDCSLDLIKESPLLGYGAGDVQGQLNQCYEDRGYTVAEYRSVGSEINSHNYYLNLWLSGGIFCLGALVYLLLHNMSMAFRLRQHVYFLFLFLFAIGLLTENLLVRMMGVFLFATFNSILFSNLLLADERN